MEKRTFKDGFMLRLPDGMRDAIKRNAAENERTMNAEIVFHLRKALGMAAGGEFGDHAPAASDHTALPGGDQSTNGCKGATDEYA